MKPRKCEVSGVALILVLASLVLLATLVVAFLSSVTAELRASKTYSAGNSAKQLAQTAVNFASAQISEATRGTDGSGNIVAWATQPGMIRTYTDQGAPRNYFRLYSWTDMTGDGAFNASLTANAVPAAWHTQKALYVDLNQPIKLPARPEDKLVYPIVDGNGLHGSLKYHNGVTMPAGSLSYDSDEDDTADIDGFFVNQAPIASGTSANPVPMPVKWLYVLEDGKIVAPDSDSSNLQAKIAGASEENPVVGRIAFWVDDETCKINVNTASEGTYWDTPRVFTKEDFDLAKFQPVQREYQRYAGHPAMTSLSSVFRKPSSGYTDQTWAEELYNIAPRVVGGGSLGGTVQLSFATDQSLPFDSARLYATVDELTFKPSMDGETPPIRNSNNPNADVDAFTKDTLQKAKFFLTACSRAPDLNLFNKPRVAIWPITLDRTTGLPVTTPFDKLIAFCSTMRNDLPTPFRYYFQRQKSEDSINDLPQNGTVSGLGRNRMLLEYLRALTSRNIPGFGGAFSSKYNSPGAGTGTECDQILTEIFDYVRSTNLRDSTLAGNWPGRYTQNLATGLSTSSDTYKASPGVGQVLPIEDTTKNTRGFGRFPTVQSAFIQFIGCANSSVNPAIEPGKIRAEAGFFIQMFDPSQGQVVNKPWYTVEVEGLDQFEWGQSDGATFPMGFPALSVIGRPIPWNMSFVNFFGGAFDYRAFVHNRGYTGAGAYPLVTPKTGGAGVAPDLPASNFYFKGGDVTIRIYLASPTGGKTGSPVQTVTMNFPDETFPSPALAKGSVTITEEDNSSSGPYNFRAFYGNTGRFNASMTMSRIASEDVVRAVVASPGDMRLLAALKEVPKTRYAKHRLYSSTASRFAHISRSGMGYPFYGASGGKLVNVSYPGFATQYTSNTDATGVLSRSNNNARDVEVAENTGVTQENGVAADWDNGVGNLRDGPYINKADEGDSGLYSGSYRVPYYSMNYTNVGSLPGPTYFSPNRLIPSPVMFGSLSTGVFAGKPWQTLLFRPGPGNHPGLGSPVNSPVGPPYTTPPDHLLLDLFHMPVVEPYAISEPLSTAGRINMNYQMIPFTYINRDTGVRAVLKSEKILSIPDTQASNYKTIQNPGGTTVPTIRFRQNIDIDATLSQFAARFGAGDIFRSATEICSLDLVPADAPAATRSNPTRAAMDAYWATRKLTGDNSRERPYATIYPRLTTRSNTFTIHYRAQSLQKRPDSEPEVWNEAADRVTGEFRGSQTIERYIDPNDSRLPDYADPADSGSEEPAGKYYRIRVLQAKQFSP